MAEILVSGYYGFGNAGDEAILGGIITAFRDIDPSFKFTVISGKAASTRQVHGVEAVSRGDFRAIWKAMGRADLLLSGGGSLLQDVTGTKSIVYYLGIVTLGKLRRLPTVFYAQGIGPVNRLVGRALVPLVANAVDLIMVRDAESAEAIRRLGVSRPEVRVTADAALVLPPSTRAEGEALLEAHGLGSCGRPLIGVSVRPWKFATAAAVEALADGLDRVVQETGGTVLFIPMQQPHDVEAARAVAARMRSRALLFEGDVTYRELRALTAACDVLVGMRYHALVFAAVNRVPLVGLSYDPKNDSLLRLLGETAVGTTQQLDAGRLRAAVLDALDRAPQIRERYDRVLAQLVPRSRENARLAVELMKRWQAR
ncbi:polysaccharide pyruvyl transferase CsaB [Symbiobacterium terraclitae]|uniref:polysaccharide pyruvyl transferase CsaB n=1 Tax=Symbiobacterium terraclitae TaxID=557451 RepID=UPI0035B56852